MYLAAVSANQIIYIFSINNKNYFQTPPKQIHLDNEIPMTLNFTDENKMILVGTNTRSQYKGKILFLFLY